jgi:hypothetical protein
MAAILTYIPDFDIPFESIDHLVTNIHQNLENSLKLRLKL